MPSELDSDVARLLETQGTLHQPVAQPRLVVISGLPGTGKSHLAGQLVERLHFLVLESDRLRKALFIKPGYQPEESARLFQTVRRLIEALLKKGISLILDAANLSEHNREYLYSIADRTGARLVMVQVEAPARAGERTAYQPPKNTAKRFRSQLVGLPEDEISGTED